MDQNYQPNEIFQHPPVVKNAAYYRKRARQALKGCYWYAFLAAMLAGFLGVSTASGNFSFDTDSFSSYVENDVSVTDAAVAFFEVWSEGGVSAVLQSYPWVALIVAIFGVAVLSTVLFNLLVGSPVTLGYERYNLDLMDGGGRDIKILFRYFKQGYGKSVALRVLYGLITTACSIPLVAATAGMMFYLGNSFLSGKATTTDAGDIGVMILLILVVVLLSIGTALAQIWLQLRYRFCFMILAEYPELGAVDALRNSAQLMKGNKWRLFCLDISFIGWILLAMITCGVGMMFLTPYINASVAAFYDDVTNRQAAKDAVFPSLNPDDYVTGEEE
ncbi:MAG: DUF975 family protein [Clostridia bacterium]|nr:DUF975 family protein [Clostridia bacterium]